MNRDRPTFAPACQVLAGRKATAGKIAANQAQVLFAATFLILARYFCLFTRHSLSVRRIVANGGEGGPI